MTPKTIPADQAKCQRLNFDAPVRLLKEPEANTLTGFDIDAYTGAVVDRWWGKLVVAVDGIQASQQLPIFRDHDPGKIVGYSTSTSNDGTFRVSGKFSDATEPAREVKALAAEGFPWQASIGVFPLAVLELGQNAVMAVNGQEVHGPAEVWLESEVYETSFVPQGADSNTRVSVFSEYEKEQPRAARPTTNKQEQKMDLEQLKTEHPDLVVALTAEIVAGLQSETLADARPDLVEALTATGAQRERDRIASVREQSIPGHEALVAQMELDGKSTGADAALAIVKAERLARTRAAESFDQQGNAPVGQPADHDAAGKKSMKRAEFDALSDGERRAALAAGVTLV